MTETLLLKIIRRGQQVGPQLLVVGDPKDARWMYDHLVNAIKREQDADLPRIGEYVMEIRPITDETRLYATFAATSRSH